MISVALIGFGRVAQHYLSVFAEIPEIRVVTIVDPDCEQQQLAKQAIPDVEVLSDLVGLRYDILDIVFVLTPSGAHYHCVQNLSADRTKVVVEKPPAMTIEQAKHLAKRASNGEFIFSVFQNRTNPAILEAKALLTKRRPKLVSVSVRLRWCRFDSYYADGWHGTWQHDGGVLYQQAIHHLDAINYLFGMPESVYCESNRIINNLEAEDTAWALLSYSEGFKVTFEATTAARPVDKEASISVVTDQGMFEINGVALNNFAPLDFSADAVEVKERVANGYGNGHRRLVEGLLDGSWGLDSSVFDWSTTVGTVALAHTLYRSIESGLKEQVSYDEASTKLGVING